MAAAAAAGPAAWAAEFAGAASDPASAWAADFRQEQQQQEQQDAAGTQTGRAAGDTQVREARRG